MPRKRVLNATPIPLELVDWLLDGHTRPCDNSDPLRRDGVYDAFIEFDIPGPNLEALWGVHKAWLLTEWKRRGGDGRPWAEREFGA